MRGRAGRRNIWIKRTTHKTLRRTLVKIRRGKERMRGRRLSKSQKLTTLAKKIRIRIVFVGNCTGINHFFFASFKIKVTHICRTENTF